MTTENKDEQIEMLRAIIKAIDPDGSKSIEAAEKLGNEHPLFIAMKKRNAIMNRECLAHYEAMRNIVMR